MSELTITETNIASDSDFDTDFDTDTCPPWCVAERTDTGLHTHSSDSSSVETLAHPLTVQLVQVADDEPRMLIDGQVATIEQAQRFATAIKRLTDAGTLAEPGLSFVVKLAAVGGITLEEMALASGIDVTRLRKQRSGGRVLTVNDVDRLALAVANLSMARDRSDDQRQNAK